MIAKKLLRILPFLLGILFSSCVQEDYTGCLWRQPLKISFSYEAEYDGTVAAGDVRSAHLYMFDNQGLFVTSWTIDDPDFSQSYDFETEVEPGRYQFVVWFNQADPYYTVPLYSGFQKGVTRMADAEFGLTLPADKHVRTPIPHVFHGILRNAEILGSGDHQFVIPVIQQSNTVRLTVKGLPVTTDAYGFSITDDNGSYTYDCSHGPCEPFTYTGPCTFTTARATGTLRASLNVLKLGEGRDARIRVVNETTGTEIYPGTSGESGNLVDLIRKVYPSGIDFDRRHLFEITLEYDNDMNIKIDIDVWGETKDDYEITK